MIVLLRLAPSIRRNLLCLFCTALCFWSSLTILLPTLPLYIESVGATQQQVGLVMGSFAIGLLLTRGVLGRWSDERSRKLVVQIGTLAVGLAPFGYLFLTSLPILALLRAIHGLSIAGMTTGYSTLVLDFAPRDQRGEVLGYMTLVVPIGMALGPAVGGFLGDAYGFPVVFVVSGLLGLIGFALASLITDAPIAPHDPDPQPPRSRSLLAWLGLGRLFTLAQSPRLQIPALVLLLVGTVFGTLTTFLPAYIRDTGVALNAGLFYTAVAIASFSVRIFTGRASDRLGRGIFITGSLVAYILSMALLTHANSALDFLLGALAEGAGAGILIPMMTALVADRSLPRERGQVYSVCIGGFDLGIALGGPMSGAFAASLGYRGMFAIATGLSLCALILFLTRSSKDLAHSFRFAIGQGRDIYAQDPHS
ncbi:MFS transporter [Spirulina major CS-329]|uniref:MFS transporter n=1 Tax=Spirulina TaxID=1154 RepID=UPI00232C2C41|nr:MULTISPECIES: MFS transporter [Spirulina]MDB9497038.1 MFS transporter [Spirulina subsalsa CS-330]MDB9504947.1 MFS transporter [Spirulina major CS-329]